MPSLRPAPTGFSRHILLVCRFILLMVCNAAFAAPIPLDQLPEGWLGQYARYVQSGGSSLSLGQARNRFLAGEVYADPHAVLTKGIEGQEVWMVLEVSNPDLRPRQVTLLSSISWTDHLDVYVFHDGQTTQRWERGDALPGAANLSLGLGYAFPLQLAPGLSEIWLRASTHDPLVLPVELLPTEQVASRSTANHYLYGLLYGFLFALIAYNGMVFIGLRERSYLYYALYLGSFIAVNLAYTGHGLALFWPDNPYLQRYVILLLMVVFGSAGLLFADRFLALPEHAPREHRALQVLMGSGLLGIMVSILLDAHHQAVLVAFVFIVLFSLIMVLFGLLAVGRGLMAGRYFLVAAICGMAGTATTALSVLGILPFTALGFHSAEIGILLEASLFGLALGRLVRAHQEARYQAETLASVDVLTGLHNRRAFTEMGEWSWSMSERKGTTLSLIILDIDHFKRVNDTLGHDGGDQVLISVAQTLSDCCRASDLLARWGGEEFVILLPETGLIEACTIAERLRKAVQGRRLEVKGQTLATTISLGVAERSGFRNLAELVADADKLLYAAKGSGRNRAVSRLSVPSQFAA